MQTLSLGVCDYFIKCVLTVLLGVLYYGCFNFMCSVIRVCVCVFVICMYVLTFSVFCSCSYLYSFVFIFCFALFKFCICFVVIVVLCIFIFVCTSVGLLPPGESPIAVSSNNTYSMEQSPS
jgi:hypothetical protein